MKSVVVEAVKAIEEGEGNSFQLIPGGGMAGAVKLDAAEVKDNGLVYLEVEGVTLAFQGEMDRPANFGLAGEDAGDVFSFQGEHFSRGDLEAATAGPSKIEWWSGFLGACTSLAETEYRKELEVEADQG